MARRVVAAALAGTAAWLAVELVRPEPPDPGEPVVVASRDISVGERLTGDVLATARLGAAVTPDGAYAAVSDVDGVAAAPLRRGEVVTDVRVSPAGALHGLPQGTVLAHVPLDDPAMAQVAAPGSTVDVLSTADGAVLADAVTVVGRPQGADDPLSAGGTAYGLYVAVSEDQAGRLARAIGADPTGGGVTVVVTQPEAGR